MLRVFAYLYFRYILIHLFTYLFTLPILGLHEKDFSSL